MTKEFYQEYLKKDNALRKQVRLFGMGVGVGVGNWSWSWSSRANPRATPPVR